MATHQRITVTGLPDAPAFTLHCEPEGGEIEVRPDDVIDLDFTSDRELTFEISLAGDGVILGRYGGGDVVIDDRRGRDLRW